MAQPTARTSKFEISKDARGEYRWVFTAKNGEEIAVPGEGFDREDTCRANIDLVKDYASDAKINDLTRPGSDGRKEDAGPEFEIYEGDDEDFRWRLQAANNQPIAVSSEGYENKGDCRRAITLVKRDAPDAPVIGEDGESGEGGYEDPNAPAKPREGRYA